jgi:dTDP-glucose 4,6-dehydratase
MKNYCILGGDGVFGIHMAKYLLDNNLAEKVICVGRNPQKPPVYTLNVGLNDARYKYYQIHITHELDALFEMFDLEKPNCIINFAALAYATSWTKSYRYYETNVVALAKMTEIIRTKNYFKHWMQIGSSEVYGSCEEFAATEETPLLSTSPYSVSKAAGDMHLMTYYKTLDFPMNIIRPSNAYAPGQQLYRVIPRAIYCGLNKIKLPLEGGGKVEKSFMHARDMANAIFQIIDRAPRGEIYNAGPKEPVMIRQIIEIVAKTIGIHFDELCEIVPGRVGEDNRYWLNNTKIEKELNWKCEISLEEGILEMVNWGKKYNIDLKNMPQQYVLRF